MTGKLPYRYLTGQITENNMPKNAVFVFGSNSRGQHDGGTANYAAQHFGAKVGVGAG